MAEGRYQDAESLAAVAQETKPGDVPSRTAALTARTVGYTTAMNTVRDMRGRGYLDVQYQTELSSIPTADEPPILYPDPEVWQLLSQRRNRYRGFDMSHRSPTEQKILAALDEPTEFDFFDQPLSDVIDYFKQRHGIEIQLDNKGLAQAGVDAATCITRHAKGITLRSALKLLLHDFDLTYVTRHEVLLITSKAEAERMPEVRVYPVADLLNRRSYWGRGGRRAGFLGGSGMVPVQVGGGMF
jgi:hypothetical protein